MKNISEMQYLNLLKTIIIENLNDSKDYKTIRDLYDAGEISVTDAYNKVLKFSDGNLEEALSDISDDRTGTGTYKIPGAKMVFDLSKGFPLLTTKKIFTKGVFEELFWFISGNTNIKLLLEKKVNIWTADAFRNYINKNNLSNEIPINSEIFNKKLNWFKEKILTDKIFADQWGNLGPVYGAQWRNFCGNDLAKKDIEKMLVEDSEFNKIFMNRVKDGKIRWNGSTGIDQLKNIVNLLKENPYSRRGLVFSYNPAEVSQQVLPACHAFFQTIVKNGVLNLTVYIRSNDMFLGAPFNIASYAALLHMLAQVGGLKIGKLIYFVGDAHIYANHLEAVKEQLSRTPNEMPKLWIDPSIKNIEDFNISHIKIENYEPQSKIIAPLSV